MSNTRCAPLSRAGLTAAALLAAVLAAPATAAHAQSPRFEVRPIAGAFLPTGAQRDLLDDAASLGGQLGWRFHENFAITGTFDWSPSRDRTTAIRTNPVFTGRKERLDVFDYNVGIEAGLPVVVAPSWTVRPYLGVGGGGRTFDYRDLDRFDTQTAPVGYGALGIDVAPAGRLGVRVEARDNVSGFKGLRGERADRQARNDVQVTGGITVRF